MFLFFSLIFIYLICLVNFLFLKNRIVFILFILKPILLSRFYYIVFSFIIFSILVIFYIELFIIIIFILLIKNKIVIKYFFYIIKKAVYINNKKNKYY